MKPELHLQQAKHNLDFANECEKKFGDIYLDWRVISVFYSALHLVKAFLETQGMETDALLHTDIAQTIEYDTNKFRNRTRIPFHKPACKAYASLRGYSEDARYNCVFLSSEATVEHQKEMFELSKQSYLIVEGYLKTRGLSVV